MREEERSATEEEVAGHERNTRREKAETHEITDGGVSLTHRDTASCTAFREFSHPVHCAKRHTVARRTARTLKLPAEVAARIRRIDYFGLSRGLYGFMLR